MMIAGAQDRRFAGKVAIVTGAASGIGRAVAERLGAEGAAVAINYVDPAHAAVVEQMVTDIEARGGRARPACADVSDVAAVERMFDDAIARWGRVDIVVNNAAWALLKPLVDLTPAELDQLLAVNVKGTVFGCQAAARRLGAGGRIINLSSSTTALALPGYGGYDATKGAVEQLTRILAQELGPRGITVNAVSPGATDTPQFRAGKDEATIARLAALSPLGRLGTVAEIAAVIAFLASAEAGWITGQNLRVNGGTA